MINLHLKTYKVQAPTNYKKTPNSEVHNRTGKSNKITTQTRPLCSLFEYHKNHFNEIVVFTPLLASSSNQRAVTVLV